MKKNIIFLFALLPISLIVVWKLTTGKKLQQKMELLIENDSLLLSAKNEGIFQFEGEENDKPEEEKRLTVMVKVNPERGIYHLPGCRFYQAKSCSLELTEEDALKQNFNKCRLE